MKKWMILITLGLVIGGYVADAKGNPLAPLKLDNPRDTVRSFMSAMSDYNAGVDTSDKELRGRIDDAIRCLNLGDTPFVLRKEKGSRAAIYLKEVIDRVIIIDYEKIPETGDDPTKPLLRWRLKDTEIVISRVDTGDRAGEYLFSEDTVYRAEEFYDKVKLLSYKSGSGAGARYREPWLDHVIPDWARTKWVLFPNWQWIGLFLAIFLGLIIKSITQSLTHLLKRFTSRTDAEWDDQIIDAIDRPAGTITASLFWFFSIYVLRFEGIALAVLSVTVQIIFSVCTIWLVYRLVNVLIRYLKVITSKTETTLDDQLVPLIGKSLKIFVVVFGVLVMFQNLGVNVMSVLAGLGLGGLAFALAAKDTCANLFGSIMILLDRPFNIGDWVIVGDTEGSVEEIGFRSTRIRTFYNSQITVPNAVIANANIDNMGRREYRRIKAYFGLTYDTPAEKMEAFLEGIKNIVEANPYTRKDYYHVVFNGYGGSSLEVLLYCFLKVPDWATELVERQNIYLEILRLAETVGVSFAFPTQTLHVETLPGQDPIRQSHVTDRGKLAEIASDFGPGGKESKPAGMGLFKPPFRECKPGQGVGSDDDG